MDLLIWRMFMRKLLIGLLVLGSISSFAGPCKVYSQYHRGEYGFRSDDYFIKKLESIGHIFTNIREEADYVVEFTAENRRSGILGLPGKGNMLINKVSLFNAEGEEVDSRVWASNHTAANAEGYWAPMVSYNDYIRIKGRKMKKMMRTKSCD